MTNHPFESFSLSGLDTSKVGNNKFVNYTLEDFRKDQGLAVIKDKAKKFINKGKNKFYGVTDLLKNKID